MPSDRKLDALVRDLLESGVAPKYIHRLTAELEDHCLDLEDEALRSGVPADAAADDARGRLGDASTIVREFARHPELRSWIYNARWLEPLLRSAAGICLLLAMPVRAIVGSDALMRYAAAAVASTTLTLGLLLAMYFAVSTQSAPYFANRLQAPVGIHEQHANAFSATPGSDAASPPDDAYGDDNDGDRLGLRSTNPPSRDRAADSSFESETGRRLHANSGDPRLLERIEGSSLKLPQRVQVDALPTPLATLPAMAAASEFRIRSAFDFGFKMADQELRPIAKVEPDYPWAAARRGLEGYVVVEYTVTTHGTVSEIVVVESSNDVFNRAALEAANGLKYQPQFIGGFAVDVRGVRATIRFLFEA